MPRRRTFSNRLAIALAAVAVLALGAGGAGAQTLNAGEFLVNMPLPGGAGGQGEQPNCTPAIETIAMAGGTAKCTLNKTVAGDTANGTVSNATLAGQYGAGFANGTMTRTCDMNQAMTMDITFAAGAIMSGGQPKIAGGGTIVMTCTWRMVFTDEKASTLEGTMEMNASMSSSDIQPTATGGADIQMDFKVYVTKGSGLFDGYTGSGSLSQEQAMSLLGGAGGGGAPAGGGGTAPPSGGGTTPPQGGGGSTLPDAVCASIGLPAGCTAQQAATACQAFPPPSGCSNFTFNATRKSVTVRQSGDALTLKLVKKAGAVRILSPLPKPGTKKAAKVKASTRVKLVATAGAVCTVKASTGKVVGKATAKDSARTLTIRAKRGSYTGARWIQATCTLDGKSFASEKVKITL